MKPIKIQCQVDDKTMNKLRQIVGMATNYPPQAAFILQVYDTGFAEGLLLPEKEAGSVSAFLKPIYDNANTLKETIHEN